MMRRLASIILVIAFFESICGHGPKQHMVCQTLDNIFEHPDEGTHAEPQQGPRGPKGPKGNPGPPGAVDYKKVGAIVEEKLSSVIRTLKDKIEKLERQVAELNSTSRTSPASTIIASTASTILASTATSDPKNTATPDTTSSEPGTVVTTTDVIPEQTTGISPSLADSTPTETMPDQQDSEVNCDIGRKILGTCFFTVVPGNSLVTYEEAKMLCAVEKGTLAVIEKPRQLALLKSYLRKQIPKGRDYNDFWLGLTYDSKKRRINRKDGTRSPPLRDWFPGYPIIEKERSAIGVEVQRDEKAPNQGLFNLALTGSVYGVVCNK